MSCIAHASSGLRRLSPGMRVLLLRRIRICAYVCARARITKSNISHADRNRLRCHYRASYTAKTDCWLSDGETLFHCLFHIIVLLSNEFKRISDRNVCKRTCVYEKQQTCQLGHFVISFHRDIFFFSTRREIHCVCIEYIDRWFSKFLDLRNQRS